MALMIIHRTLQVMQSSTLHKLQDDHLALYLMFDTCYVGYQFINGISVKINNVSGVLLANVTDSAVSAGGNDVTIGSISVSLQADR